MKKPTWLVRGFPSHGHDDPECKLSKFHEMPGPWSSKSHWFILNHHFCWLNPCIPVWIAPTSQHIFEARSAPCFELLPSLRSPSSLVEFEVGELDFVMNDESRERNMKMKYQVFQVSSYSKAKVLESNISPFVSVKFEKGPLPMCGIWGFHPGGLYFHEKKPSRFEVNSPEFSSWCDRNGF